MNLPKIGKKAAIAELMPVVIALVSIAITLIVGFLILAELSTNSKVTADTNATKAVEEVQDAMDDIPGWLPIIVITITLIVGFLILAELSTNTKVAADTNATKAVKEVQDAMDDIPGWLPIIVITIIGAILLSLVAYFRGGR